MKPTPKPNAMQQIKRIQIKRQERRKKMEQEKQVKQQKKAYNLASGKNVDIDFQLMIQKNRFKQKMLCSHSSSSNVKLAVCVRKRPIFKKEEQNGQIDSISCANPQIRILEPKYKVDGITKYVENHIFTFDNTFNQKQGSEDIYKVSLKPILNLLINNGIITCFAYGQTGSGKTYTMNQLQKLVVTQIFQMIKKKYNIVVSFYQIYSGRCLDLLNNKQSLQILQDQSNFIQIQGLTQKQAKTSKQLLSIMQQGNSIRTTHATVANDTSSRSHAVCQIQIKKGGQEVGKLVLVDLAGSERAQDTQSNNRQRRMEGAQINKSLLALKQCIRAMESKADHIPFRASKLTLILRDSFISKADKSKVIMIACISPGSSSTDHSLNTLRYADRLKDNSQLNQKYNKLAQESKANLEIQNHNQIVKQKLQKNGGKGAKKQKQDQGLGKIFPDISIKKQQSIAKSSKNNQIDVIAPIKNITKDKRKIIQKQKANQNNNEKNRNKIKQKQDNKVLQSIKILNDSINKKQQAKLKKQEQKKIENKKDSNEIKKQIKKQQITIKKQQNKRIQEQKQKQKQKQQRVSQRPSIKTASVYKTRGLQNLNQKRVGNNTNNSNSHQQIQLKNINPKNENSNNGKAKTIEQKRYKQNQHIDSQIAQQIYAQESGARSPNKRGKKLVKEDINLIQKSLKNQNKQQYFAYQQKVANVFQQRQQVLATHIAAIKQDAKLLSHQSDLVTKMQNDYGNSVDNDGDLDVYVDKLENLIKKKIKIYNILNNKLDVLKKVLKEEDQSRQNIKDTFYY